MHIFIDEAGSFTGTGKPVSPSVVGALVIPDGKLEFIRKKYSHLRRQLPMDRGEVKGRLLTEAQVAKVVELLRRNEVIFEGVMIDMGLHELSALEKHKENQARGIVSQLTADHHESIHIGLKRLKKQLERMPLQLYVQSVLIFELVNITINHSCAYYSQRRPQELGSFHWIIDAKDKSITEWETWWSFCVMPMVQSKSLREPGMRLAWADYTYLERFLTDPLSDYFDQFMAKPKSASDPRPLDLRKIMTESIRFSSDAEFGLELVDIVTTSIRRALAGHLRDNGWSGIPKLMINRKSQTLKIVTLHGKDYYPQKSLPYHAVLEAFLDGGKSLLSPSALRERI